MTRWLIMIGLTLAILGSGYAVVAVYLGEQAKQFDVQRTVTSGELSKSVTTNLSVDSLLSPQWVAQNHDFTGDLVQQYFGVADAVLEPLAPVEFNATDTTLGKRVMLSWKLAPGQSHQIIEIQRSLKANMEDAELVSTVTSVTDSWFDLNLDNKKTYYYQARVGRQTDSTALQYSSWSDPVSVTPTDLIPPVVPTGITVKPVTTAVGLTINWDISQSIDVANYRVYKSAVFGELGKKISDDLSSTTVSFLDSDVVPGQTYYYTVTALDAAGNESSKAIVTSQSGNSNPFKNGN